MKLLDENLECIDYKLKKDKIMLLVKSAKKSICYPYCGCISNKVHSEYQREIQDISMQDKQTILLLNTRKMFCLNEECSHKTFSERFDVISSNGKKTKRLIDKILIASTKLSSVNASLFLKNSSIKVCKSSICDLFKKMPDIVDKSTITKVCVDDFAFRKRYTYGTVMVDLETQRIIGIIDSREIK